MPTVLGSPPRAPDLRQPYKAEAIGSLSVGNAPTWLYLQGGILYCTITNDSRLRSFDVGAGVPRLLGTLAVGSNSAGIVGRGKYLFVPDANAGVVRSINVSDPTNMQVAHTLSVEGAASSSRPALQLLGRYLLLGGPESGANANRASLLDVANPLSMQTMGQITVGSIHRGCIAVGDHHFALTSRNEHKVYILDISNPLLPVVRSSFATTVSNTTAAIATQGPYLFVGDYGNGTTLGGFEMWDVSTPSAPVQAGTLAIPGGVEQMVIRGRYAYLGCRNSFKTLVIDHVNPAKPVQVASLDVGSFATPGIAAGNGYIWRTSAESSGSPNGKVYALREMFDVVGRITELEELLACRVAA